MVIYNTKSWTKVFLSGLGFGNAYNNKSLFVIIAVILLYTSFITCLRIYLLPKELFEIRLTPTYLSLVGVILGLVLVFRINSAYDRWWEGRKLWGALINESRTLASNFTSLLPEADYANRSYLAAQIANFAYALKGHLREEIDYTHLDTNGDEGYLVSLKKARHLPHHIATLIFFKMEALFRDKVLSEADKINIKQQIEQMVNIMGACERIKNSPIPFSHTSFIKSFIMFYSVVLPIGLVDSFQFYTIPAVFIISYALAGVEVISEEIEQPFGTDANDLPLRHLSNVIKQNVYDTMQVPLEKELPSPLLSNGVVI